MGHIPDKVNLIALRWGAIFMVLLAAGGIGLHLVSQERPNVIPRAYWIWAGITEREVPRHQDYFIYQGQFDTKMGETRYDRIGIYPYPIQAQSIILVYRMVGDFPPPSQVISVFRSQASKWQRHGVRVIGVQIDFDSATSRLPLYGNFLQDFRRELPSDYRLSVTGLGDWILYGDQSALRKMSSAVDDIVFQLYQERKAIDSADSYIKELESFPFAFRVGLLSGVQSEKSLNSLIDNPNFKGVVYFVQR